MSKISVETLVGHCWSNLGQCATLSWGRFNRSDCRGVEISLGIWPNAGLGILQDKRQVALSDSLCLGPVARSAIEIIKNLGKLFDASEEYKR